MLLLVATLAAAACGRAEHASPPARPNVLLVTIDTFRADRVGTGVAPAIDRLAATGLRFSSARTTAPLTLPAHSTVHTGLLPPVHGVRENGAALAETHQTIARILGGAGYDTAAFVGAFVLDRRFGLAQGFTVYDDQVPRDPNATERLEAERPASAVVDRALAWLDKRTPPAPPPPPQPHPPSSCGSTSTIHTRRTRRRPSIGSAPRRRTTPKSPTPTRSCRGCSSSCVCRASSIGRS